MCKHIQGLEGSTVCVALVNGIQCGRNLALDEHTMEPYEVLCYRLCRLHLDQRLKDHKNYHQFGDNFDHEWDRLKQHSLGRTIKQERVLFIRKARKELQLRTIYKKKYQIRHSPSHESFVNDMNIAIKQMLNLNLFSQAEIKKYLDERQAQELAFEEAKQEYEEQQQKLKEAQYDIWLQVRPVSNLEPENWDD